MKYFAFILNLPWTLLGLGAGLVSLPKNVSIHQNPFAIVLRVRSFWWFAWRRGMKRTRGMVIGTVVLLGPLEIENDLEHELVHVRQIAREPFIHPFLYTYQNWKYGYRNNKYEREAYDMTGSVYVFNGSKMALLIDGNIGIRKAQTEDALFCYNLIQENMNTYNPSPKTFDQYATEFIPNDVYIVCIDNEPVGFVEFQEKSDTWYLWDMQLSSSMQGMGLGSELLRFVENEVKSKGGEKIVLNAYKTNPAVRLYERNGFEIFDEKENRYAMSKSLVGE